MKERDGKKEKWNLLANEQLHKTSNEIIAEDGR